MAYPEKDFFTLLSNDYLKNDNLLITNTPMADCTQTHVNDLSAMIMDYCQ